MVLQFITDSKGKKKAVIVPVADFEQMQEELERYRNAERVKHELRESIAEMKAIQAGKKPYKLAKDLLNEL